MIPDAATGLNLPDWTDSHCHLAMDPLWADPAGVLERARAAGVRRVVCVGTQPADWQACAALGELPGLRSTAGLHPHEARHFSNDLFEGLRTALGRPGVAAVGEIGLDYHYDLSPREIQKTAFEAQASLALSLGLPTVIHSRLAFEDTLAVLKGLGPRLRGVLHCFSYGPAEAEAFLNLGFLISFSGICTFANAVQTREAARAVPLSRMLLETDGPYLAPVPFRGKPCEPAHVAITGRYLAQLLGIDPTEIAARTTTNAVDFFRFPEGSRLGD